MQSDVVIIGGGPAGIVTAMTTKRVYPDVSVLMTKEIGDGVIPCAIPYMIQSLSAPEQKPPLRRASREQSSSVFGSYARFRARYPHFRQELAMYLSPVPV